MKRGAKMDSGNAVGITVTFTRGNGKLTKSTAKAFTSGPVAKFMTVNGKMTKLKDWAK